MLFNTIVDKTSVSKMVSEKLNIYCPFAAFPRWWWRRTWTWTRTPRRTNRSTWGWLCTWRQSSFWGTPIKMSGCLWPAVSQTSFAFMPQRHLTPCMTNSRYANTFMHSFVLDLNMLMVWLQYLLLPAGYFSVHHKTAERVRGHQECPVQSLFLLARGKYTDMSLYAVGGILFCRC